jgi:hypothetical protein
MANNNLQRQVRKVITKGRFTSTPIDLEDEGLEGGIYARWGTLVVWPQYNPEGLVLYDLYTKKKKLLRSKHFHKMFDNVSSRAIVG